jgi:predicted ATP-dependent protease
MALMLRDDLVEAVAAGQFHIWAAAEVDEAVELLTNVPAGQIKCRRRVSAGEPTSRRH